MSMTLVNGYLAYKFLPPHDPTFREFLNRVALAMCADEAVRAEVDVAAGTRLAQLRSKVVRASISDPGRLGHQLCSAKYLSLGGYGAEGKI